MGFEFTNYMITKEFCVAVAVTSAIVANVLEM
jgi:hypothetical protein